jgi:hypothetical protein
MIPKEQSIVIERSIDRVFEFEPETGKFQWVSIRQSDYPVFLLDKCDECNSPICVSLKAIQETIHRMYIDYEHFKEHQKYYARPLKKRGIMNKQRLSMYDTRDIHRNLNPYKN